MEKYEYFFPLLNSCIRGASLLAKFSLILFLAKYFQPEDVGLYGLIVSTVTYGLYPLGLEFYLYNNREIIKSKKHKLGGLIRNQIALYLRTYVFFIPLFLTIFFADLLPWRIAAYYLIIQIFEHANQEAMRLLIAMSKQISASISLFIRQALWVIPAMLWIHTTPTARNLDFILFSWLTCSILSFIFSAIIIYFMRISGWHLPTDWASIRKGLKISIPLLAGTLCFNSLFTLDKYFFKFLESQEKLGAYIFFFSLASSLFSIIDSAIVSFIYPKMVIASASNNILAKRYYLKKMANQIFVLYIAFFMASCFSIRFILSLINDPLYTENIYLFYLSLAVAFFYSIRYAPHYFLYSSQKDKILVASQISGLPIFIIFISIFSLLSPSAAVPLSLCLTFFTIFVWESIVTISMLK